MSGPLTCAQPIASNHSSAIPGLGDLAINAFHALVRFRVGGAASGNSLSSARASLQEAARPFLSETIRWLCMGFSACIISSTMTYSSGSVGFVTSSVLRRMVCRELRRPTSSS